MMRPTLAKRVIFALLLAFVLVWMVLLARDFLHATDARAFDANLTLSGDSLLESIATLDDPAAASAVIGANARLIAQTYRNNHLPGTVLLALLDARGRRIAVTPDAGGARLHGAPGPIAGVVIDGQPYRLYAARNARWTLMLAAPVLSRWWIFQSMGANLMVDMLIAFPFVLLPIWIAVTRGLRPLRQLSSQIAARGPNDLQALGYTPRHAELQPLAAGLDRLLEQLRNKVAREYGFVQDAAHELRTPMAVMSAQAHVLMMETDPARRVQAARQMQQAMTRASHMVDQLLTMASMDHQGGSPVRLDIAQLLRAELALLAPGALARGIDLSLDAPDTLPRALDLNAFQSIVHNLVNNAIAYIPEHGRIDVLLAADDAHLRLVVADDGPGIPAQQREHVFERFHRGCGQTAPGAGLGLAIVREAVARLGGTVRLEDGIDGKGCRFVVTVAAPLQA